MNAMVEAAAEIDPRWVLGILLGALDLWAAGLVWFSGATRRDKGLWTVVIVACPIIGCLFWFVLGPKWRPSPGESPPTV